ncbi:NAD(P)-binding protein [Neolentinus lepideus HHB14362 ss-1]|uniref:NAD(P)-binding protein n=1 Tax=Neolentinus lepideus HHB14362 ss-1 TaxID=1314782 RepID=A0A165PG17_9AGAM|nr:NAD(P)-binding protein [Neolentinus lepideus HHB14362 ss-1]
MGKFDPSTDLSDLSGKVAIVTGASSGIGLYTVLHLVRKGATVYLGARSQSKADQAIARLQSEGLGSSPGQIKWIDLDLTDPRAAKRAAERFLTQENRLDILVNNAGKLISPYGRTADGISDSMMVNHISPFLFTQTLLPLMEQTSADGGDVRVVNLSSEMHEFAYKPRYDSIEAINDDFSSSLMPQSRLYAYSKLANILYTKELQRRLDSTGSKILVTAIHPGSVLTEGTIRMFASFYCGGFLNWLASLFFAIPVVGAYPSVFAAASHVVRRDADHYKGQYIVPGNSVKKTSKDSENMTLAADLWETTQLLLKQLGV